MAPAVAELLEAFDLPETLAVLNAHMAEEQRRRERFRDELTGEKAEFINGEIIVHSPNKAAHIRVRSHLEHLFSAYLATGGTGEIFTEKALCEFPRNDYEPDLCYFCAERAALITPDTMVFPIPDLIVEVLSSSTERRDRGIKLHDYEAHGVQEYWIVDPEAQFIEQYLLSSESKGYRLEVKSSSGEIVSAVVSGFRFPVRALFDSTENSRAVGQFWQAKA